MSGARLVFLGILTVLTSACTSTGVQPVDSSSLRANYRVQRDPWLLVDTRNDVLMIMQGTKPMRAFSKIALGSSGAGIKYGRGDNKTPLGVFRVGWVNENSRFNKFIGLDYPNLDYAGRALRDQRIDALTYERIRAAWTYGYTPPQDTLLGGQIGIHGIGYGDPGVHSAGINWTSGCVALNDWQIDALMPWVKVGMRVEIR